MNRAEQLMKAAATVTNMTDRRRVAALRRMLCRELRRRPTAIKAAIHYYVTIGTVPRSLWET